MDIQREHGRENGDTSPSTSDDWTDAIVTRSAGEVRVMVAARRAQARGQAAQQMKPESDQVRGYMKFNIECGCEDDGRWIAEVAQLPGAMAYGDSKEAAVAKVQALALRMLAEQIEYGEICSPTIAITISAHE